MPDIECPECSQVTQLVAVRRAADEFCTQCDYPLFWAPSAVPMATPGSSNLATLRRLPGAGGRQRVGTKVCPECGELNPTGPTHTHCIRCTADLDPKPVPIVTETVLIVPPQRSPPPKPPWWPWPAIAVVVVVQIVLLIVGIT